MNVADMLSKSRYASGMSQQAIASAMGINKTTVQNWESGYSCPSFDKIIEWFDAVGQPMYPYLMSMIYPEEVAGISKDNSDDELRKVLHKYIDELDSLHMRELLFLLHGEHGSSPTGTLDVVTTYLHLPLAMRVCVTDNLLTTYEVADSVGLIQDERKILPKKETLKKFVDTAKQAVLHGKETYIIKED